MGNRANIIFTDESENEHFLLVYICIGMGDLRVYMPSLMRWKGDIFV